MDPQFYMRRALELAALGIGKVSPNPMVGCVIVYQDTIIGEGWHKVCGGPHAEVNAIESVHDKGLLNKSRVFVTLEPCAHFGKTPPCADLLVKHQVQAVNIAVADTNPLVGGKGIARLKGSGIAVETGLLENESLELNRRFFTFMEKKRPYIVLKWAETRDSFIARENFDAKWISSSYSRRLVHKWRTEEDAILVGTNTAHYDNPMLTARDWPGKDPIRIVIDRNLRLNTDLHLFDHSRLTICYNLHKQVEEENLLYVKLDKESFLQALLQDLYERGIQSVFVEGGAGILNQFLEQQLWDEARIFKAKTAFGNGVVAPLIKGELIQEEDLPEGDRLLVYKR